MGGATHMGAEPPEVSYILFKNLVKCAMLMYILKHFLQIVFGVFLRRIYYIPN